MYRFASSSAQKLKIFVALAYNPTFAILGKQSPVVLTVLSLPRVKF